MINLIGFTIPGAETAIFIGVVAGIVWALSFGLVELVIDLCGTCYDVFRSMLSGQFSTSTGENGIGTSDFAYKLIQNEVVQKLFTTLLIVAIILLVLSTIVKTITSEFNFQKDGNAKSKILWDAVKALALFVVIPIVSILGLMLANFLLGVIIKALEAAVGVSNGSNLVNLLNSIKSDVRGFGSLTQGVLSTFGVVNFIIMGCFWPIAKKLLGATIGMFQRMFDIAIMWAISAPIIALLPITEGPYKSWVKEYTQRVLGLFGIVVSVNIMVFVINIADSCINEVGLSGLYLFVARLAALYAGTALIEEFAKLISGMIGGKDYGASGAALGANMFGAATSGFKKATGAVGAANMARRVAKAKLAEHKAAKADKEERLSKNDAYQKAKDENEDIKKKNERQKELEGNESLLDDDAKKELADLRAGKAERDKKYNDNKDLMKAEEKKAKHRISASARQKDKMQELSKLGDQLKDQEKGSAGYNETLKQMEAAQKDLKDMGVNDKQIKAGLDAIKEGNLEDGLESINKGIDTVSKYGVKTGAVFGAGLIGAKKGNQLRELMAERSANGAKLHADADEAGKKYSELIASEDVKNMRQADADLVSAKNDIASYESETAEEVEKFKAIEAEGGRLSEEDRKRYDTIKTKRKNLDNKLSQAQVVASRYDTTRKDVVEKEKDWISKQSAARNNDKFIKQTKGVLEAPRAPKRAIASATLDLATSWFLSGDKNLTEIGTTAKSLFHTITEGSKYDITAKGLEAAAKEADKKYQEIYAENIDLKDMGDWDKKLGGLTPAQAKYNFRIEETRLKNSVDNIENARKAIVAKLMDPSGSAPMTKEQAEQTTIVKAYDEAKRLRSEMNDAIRDKQVNDYIEEYNKALNNVFAGLSSAQVADLKDVMAIKMETKDEDGTDKTITLDESAMQDRFKKFKEAADAGTKKEEKQKERTKKKYNNTPK